MTLNGTDFTANAHVFPPSLCVPGMTYHWYSYLPAPTSGTFSMTWGSTENVDVAVFTVQNASQSNPIDAANLSCGTGSSWSTSLTTTGSYDLLLSWPSWQTAGNFSSYGTGESQITNGTNTNWGSKEQPSWKAASSTSGLETMTTNLDSSRNIDLMVVAVKGLPISLGSTTSNTYAYSGTGYANPHALTQLSNGLSTTSYAYDNDGNVTQKTTDGTSTTYVWDYANRLIALGSGGATTTYSYDAFGQRVLQTGTSTTWIYPSKFYTIASSTGSGAKYSTTTESIFNGDTLLSTVDQQMANGAATGTAKTRYIHPDHLGSTNVVTDVSGNISETTDYYPYGSTRIDTGSSVVGRKYIGQFSDQSNLSYLQARYYDPSRGQFLSEDPVFWGDPKEQDLTNPQSLNSYSYANDNPITSKDPNGKQAIPAPLIAAIIQTLQRILVFLAAYSVASSQPVQNSVTHLADSVVSSSYQTGAQQQTFSSTPLVNTGASRTQSGVSVTPLNPVPWTNVNLSQRITLPAPDQLSGKTPQEINQILQEKGLNGRPSRDGDGVRYDVPGQPGDQVRLMPGNPGDSNPAKQVPYGRVTQNGKTSDPFPISGKPTPNP
jgi:RHS repeat-associated protein